MGRRRGWGGRVLHVEAAKGAGAYCTGGLLLNIGGPPHGLDVFGAARRAGVWGMALLLLVSLVWERRERLRAGTGAATGACAVRLEKLLRT